SMLAWPPVENLARSFLWDTGASPGAPLLASLVFVVLAIGVIGTLIWRAVFASLAREQGLHGIGRLAIAFGAGILIGQFLSFDLQNLYGDVETGVAGSWGFKALWAITLFASLFGLFRWIAGSATLWLLSAATERSPHFVYGVGLCIAAVWLASLFG